MPWIKNSVHSVNPVQEPFPDQAVSSNSDESCCFKCRRADFLIARRSAVTACFSACRSWRVRVSMARGKWEIFGRLAPTFRSLGFAYGSIPHLTIWRFSDLANVELFSLNRKSRVIDAPDHHTDETVARFDFHRKP